MAQASYRSKYHLLDEARCPIVSTVTRRPLGLAALHSRKTAMQAFSNHRTSCISPASKDRSDREWKSMEPIIELYNHRSEERRVRKECVSTCRSGCEQDK